MNSSGKNWTNMGLNQATEMLSGLDEETRERIIGEIREVDPELAHQLRQGTARFESIGELEDPDRQTFLVEVEDRDLLLALRNQPELMDPIFRSLPQRRGNELREQMESMGPQPLSKVRESQVKISQQLAKWKKQRGIK